MYVCMYRRILTQAHTRTHTYTNILTYCGTGRHIHTYTDIVLFLATPSPPFPLFPFFPTALLSPSYPSSLPPLLSPSYPSSLPPLLSPLLSPSYHSIQKPDSRFFCFHHIIMPLSFFTSF